MNSKTLLSMSEAAEMVGLTRPTFYRKVGELGISVTEDNGKKKVDASELIRVFGSDVKVKREGASTAPKMSVDKKSAALNTDGDADTKIRLAVLEVELEREKKLREETKEQVEYFKEQIALEKEEKNKITLLLEDHNKKNDRSQDWEKSMKAIEARIANQEVKSKEEQERAQKILRQNQALKKALDAERNKSVWQKLFG